MKPFSESRPRPGAPATGVRFDLDAIIDRFQAPLLRYAQQMLGPGSGEAEEVVQDTFIRLHRQVMRHGPHSIDNLPGWLSEWLIIWPATQAGNGGNASGPAKP